MVPMSSRSARFRSPAAPIFFRSARFPRLRSTASKVASQIIPPLGLPSSDVVKKFRGGGINFFHRQKSWPPQLFFRWKKVDPPPTTFFWALDTICSVFCQWVSHQFRRFLERKPYRWSSHRLFFKVLQNETKKEEISENPIGGAPTGSPKWAKMSKFEQLPLGKGYSKVRLG